MGSSADGRSQRTAAFAAFLRACREQVRPEDFGIEAHQRRRVPGLRREEVAHLAGLSNTWYTRLEQGADVRPRVDVVDAIARALRLDHDAHSHLRLLAGFPGDIERAPLSAHAALADVDDLQVLVDQFLPNPACIVDDAYDFLAWNETYVATTELDLSALPERRRNLLWVTFCGCNHDAEGWETMAAAIIAHFRWNSVGRIDDPRLAELVEELSTTSTEFARLWSRFAVSRETVGGSTMTHPDVGTIRLRPTLELRLRDRPAFLKVRLARSDVDRRLLESLLALPAPPSGCPRQWQRAFAPNSRALAAAVS